MAVLGEEEKRKYNAFKWEICYRWRTSIGGAARYEYFLEDY